MKATFIIDGTEYQVNDRLKLRNIANVVPGLIKDFEIKELEVSGIEEFNALQNALTSLRKKFYDLSNMTSTYSSQFTIKFK